MLRLSSCRIERGNEVSSVCTRPTAAMANLFVALFVLLTSAPASAHVQIIYEAEDLPNSRGGGDVWKYTYTVSGWPFAEQEGFRIYFPSDLYTNLEVLDFPPQWDAVANLPDDILPDQAFLAQTLENTSAPAVFVVKFEWLNGFDFPGSQHYELFGPDFKTLSPPGTLDTLSQPIPEPQTTVLMLAGLLLVARVMHRQRPWSRA